MADENIKWRFCTSCQADREEATGEYRQLNKTRRWVCRACIERKAVSIYRNVERRKHDGPRSNAAGTRSTSDLR